VAKTWNSSYGEHTPNASEVRKLLRDAEREAAAGNVEEASNLARSAIQFAPSRQELNRIVGLQSEYMRQFNVTQGTSDINVEPIAGEPEVTPPARTGGRPPKPGSVRETVQKTREQVYMDYAWVLALVEADKTNSLRNVFNWIIRKSVENARRDVPLAQPFTEAELEREISRTEWKKSRDSIRAQADIDRERFPQDWERSVADIRANLVELAQQYGIQISDEDLDNLALEARLAGWDRDQTRRSLEPFLQSTLADEGDLMGTAGDTETELLNWVRLNGLDLSRQDLANYISNITLGRQTLADAQQDIRQTYLAGMYPAWADRIRAGDDPSNIFAPYRNSARNLLELDTIDLNDPIMKRAAQYVGPDGKPGQLPLYEFESEIRKDPRWQYTDNAYESYTSVGTDLLRMFGLR